MERRSFNDVHAGGIDCPAAAVHERTWPASVRAAFYLALTAGALLLSFVIQGWAVSAARHYYGFSMAGEGLQVDDAGVGHCDILASMRLQSGQRNEQVAIEACDVFLYTGTVAAVGLLVFLLVYFCFVVVGLVAVAVTPAPFKRVTLIGWSVVFLVTALPVRPVAWLLELAVGLCLIWRVSALPRRVRACLLVGVTSFFYVWRGPAILDACTSNSFSFTRLHLPSMGGGPLLEGVNAFLAFLHLGQLNEPAAHVEGFPYLFVALALLIKLFRRVLRLAHEVWTGCADNGDEGDVLLYLIGLPMLIGEAYTPSFRGFNASRGCGPGLVDGARSLAASMGFCALAHTVLVALAYSPAVRMMFPYCNLAYPSAGTIWVALITLFVIRYAYLLLTTQSAVAVSRMFGYGVRDNFDAPLEATSPADFWRRWNVHWREFLVSAFYYPALLFLARRNGGRQKSLHVLIGVALTFTGTLALNVLPVVMLTGVPLPEAPTHLAAAMDNPRVPVGVSALDWKRTLPSLAAYYALDGLAVACFLIAGTGGPRRRPRHVARLASVLLTFLFMAALRCFLISQLTLWQQLRWLARALGMA